MAERAEEATLAVSQALIQQALDGSGVHQRVIAQRVGCTQKHLTEVRRGDYDRLTVKEFARVLSACGFDVSMSISPHRSGGRERNAK